MEHYGVHFNSMGKANCCFHEEETPSLSIKDERFKCFGCDAGGDSIDFVRLMFDLPFMKAVERIDQDFLLGLTKCITSKKEISKSQQERQKRRDEIKKNQDEYMWFTRYHRLLVRALKSRAPKRIGEPINERYAAACRNYDYVEHWLYTHEWVRGGD